MSYDREELIRMCLQLRDQGYSRYAIAQKLNFAGVKTAKGKPFTGTQIQRLIGKRGDEMDAELRAEFPNLFKRPEAPEEIDSPEPPYVPEERDAVWAFNQYLAILEDLRPTTCPLGPYFLTTYTGGGWGGRSGERDLEAGTARTRAVSADEWWAHRLDVRDRQVRTLLAYMEEMGTPFTWFDPADPAGATKVGERRAEAFDKQQATQDIGHLGIGDKEGWDSGVEDLVEEFSARQGWEIHELLDRLMKPKNSRDDGGCRAQIRKLVYGLMREVLLQRSANLSLRMNNPEMRQRLEQRMAARREREAKSPEQIETASRLEAIRERAQGFSKGLDRRWRE